MFETIKNILQGQKVNLVAVEGDKEITRVEYVSGAEKQPNQITNLFDLLGYEIRSETIEIYWEKKFLGRGYIGDLAGMTVNIDRILPADPEFTDPEQLPEAGLDPCIRGVAPSTFIERPFWGWGPCTTTPCMIIEGSPKVALVRFEYLREIEGAVIDDLNKKRYTTKPETRIEIKMPDGIIGQGYVCDPTGRTIRIKRNVTVKAKIKKVVDGKEISEEVQTEIRFSGILAKLSSGDRISKHLSGMPGREGLLQMGLAFLVGLVLRSMF